jgi:hypothetical protein
MINSTQTNLKTVKQSNFTKKYFLFIILFYFLTIKKSILSSNAVTSVHVY